VQTFRDSVCVDRDKSLHHTYRLPTFSTPPCSSSGTVTLTVYLSLRSLSFRGQIYPSCIYNSLQAITSDRRPIDPRPRKSQPKPEGFTSKHPLVTATLSNIYLVARQPHHSSPKVSLPSRRPYLPSCFPSSPDASLIIPLRDQ
jgi:hypothetical protein